MPDYLHPVASLCSTCESGVLFQDDQKFLNDGVDANGRPMLVKSETTALTVSGSVLMREDTLPDLPSLEESSKSGCAFCGFVRDIISSEDTQHEARRIFGSTFTEMKDTLDVSIRIQFRWKNELEHDCRGDGLLGMIILLCFDDGETEIALFCLSEGLTG